MIDRLAIYLLLAGSLTFGAIIYKEVEPTADENVAQHEVRGQSNIAPAVHRQPSTRLDELLAVILARPLFSSNRRPPQSAGKEDVTSSDLADTRLTGIVTEPGHRVAIFAVNGAKPLTLSEGEDVSGWHIESITPREVSLSGPGGTKTLEPKIDPNLVHTAQGPAPAAPAAVRPPAVPPAAAAAPPRPGVPPVPPLPRPRPAARRQ
ncbi:MAG TPA: hypothetical protein VKF83_03000 [Stellaceae bacterium]|nr:hypothetical protein [Stellaceae bacterium]